MALPHDRGDREYQKFVDTIDGPAVRTVTDLSGMSIDAVPAGLHVAIKITTMLVGDTQSALPATPLSQRNAMVVTNLDLTEILYVGPTGVTADAVVGTTSGHEVNPGEGFQLDIQDDIILYGIAPTGKTIKVKVTELA